MVLINDNRPRDWVYMVAFKEKDLPSLQTMMKHIRETHDVDMIESFNKKCEQKLQGQSATLDNGIEIQGVEKTNDLVTNGGLQHCINLILATTGTLFSYIIASRSIVLVLPTITDTALNTTSGGPYSFPLEWRESKGMKLFFAALVPQDANVSNNPQIINEMAVYSGPAMTNVMLNHEIFFNNQLELNRDTTPDLMRYANVFILSCIVEFCPVA